MAPADASQIKGTGTEIAAMINNLLCENRIYGSLFLYCRIV